ncbi:nucleotidyltransferase domain-containing protein [Rickettsiales bacterium]|nr:nucleotidyltransferase domain-containing protein [Rickettsiales bacterium]
MSNFGLSESNIKIILEILRKYQLIEKVVIYGSRAKGNYKDGSDIDLVIFGDNLDNYLSKISSDFDDSLLPYKIDLSIFSDINNESLRDHIKRVGKVFYKKAQ